MIELIKPPEIIKLPRVITPPLRKIIDPSMKLIISPPVKKVLTPFDPIKMGKIEEINTNLAKNDFLFESRQCAKKLLLGESICFSDIVTRFAGLSQLTYEVRQGYCFGEDDGTTTPLNSAQIIRLEHAIREILNSIIIKIVELEPSLRFKLHGNYISDGEYNFGTKGNTGDYEEYTQYGMLRLIKNEGVSDQTIERISSILEGEISYPTRDSTGSSVVLY